MGSRGLVIATHFSKNDLKILQQRVETQNWEAEGELYGKVKVLHDSEALVRVHPEVTYADAVVSIGMLAYLQDVRNVLAEVRRVLPDSGRICFVEYTDYFHLIPNPEWLSSNERIERMFREAGFSVRVLRKRGLLWNYAFINGIKFRQDVAFA